MSVRKGLCARIVREICVLTVSFCIGAVTDYAWSSFSCDVHITIYYEILVMLWFDLRFVGNFELNYYFMLISMKLCNCYVS